MKTNVQVGIPLLDMDLLFSVVAAEVVMDQETLYILAEVMGILEFPLRFLRCTILVGNTQCVDSHENYGEGDWIETEEQFELD